MRYWLTFAFACSSPQPQIQATTQTTSPAVTIDASITTRGVDARVADALVVARVDAAAPQPRTCAAKPNPAGCPASEPNINASCAKAKLECTYGFDCCKPVYVCLKQKSDRQLRFEAHFRGCE